jgi:hypothetical protein
MSANRFFCLVTFTLGCVCSIGLGHEPAKAAKAGEGKNADTLQALAGAWSLTGEAGEVGGKKLGPRIKFWGKKHWSITQSEADSGKVVFHHGGTFTLDGDKYEETVTFANENTVHMIGMKLKFTITVKDDTYKQVGDGNPYDEVWTRLK